MMRSDLGKAKGGNVGKEGDDCVEEPKYEESMVRGNKVVASFPAVKS